MDGVRQWWLDDGWPFVQRVRWFAAAWLVLALVAIPWGVRAQERNLEAASRDALAEAGVQVDDVIFTGRSGTVVGSLTAQERSTAESILADVAGIREVEWQVALSTPEQPVVTTTTTTTTTLPPDTVYATMEAKVVAGRLVVRGVLPDARTAAEVGSMGELLFGPSIGNTLLVDDVAVTVWVSAAADVIAVLPMVADSEIVLDGDGVTFTATAATDEAAGAVQSALRGVLGPDVPIDFDISVADGDLPTFEIVASGEGPVTISGTVPRRKLLDEITTAVVATSRGAEPTNEMAVGKLLAEAYVVTRAPQLVSVVGTVDQWSLRFVDGALSGGIAGDGLFRGKQAAPTVRLERVLGELGALMIGNPDHVLTLDIGTLVAGDDVEANNELARRRGFAALSVLVRAGVEPDRIQTNAVDGEGELLRFRLQLADR